MERLVDWYWEHGIKRGSDPTDPDCELRKISIGGWLDPIVRRLDRAKAIHANASSKACLAVWGPSQSGKSTMMSRYIDGDLNDGTDSALTWSSDHKTRFSIPANGISVVPPETLIFNPFNHNSDASGVATRYTLKSVADNVNTDYPVEMRFTTRSQIIQSLSRGYLSECEHENKSFKAIDLLDRAAKKENASAARKDAYALVKDIANVMEFMSGQPRFYDMFKNDDEWSATRQKLVSSPGLLGSKAEAENFLFEIFWDSEPLLTDFYRKTDSLLNELVQNQWKGCKVLASLEVGALLLDIDSYTSYCDSESSNAATASSAVSGRNVEQEIRRKVSGLTYERVGDEIHLFIDPNGNGNASISGEAFGVFQAICGELIVPMKEENLRNKNDFVELAKKCDFLDFPGVSNKNPGNDLKNVALLDLTKLSKEVQDERNPEARRQKEKALKAVICTKVFKQGKTQCFVFNYAKSYGIDAFAILVRTDLFPSQSGTLNTGVFDWMRSFDPNWKPGRKFESMPIFVNMTFFASLINDVDSNGTGNSLKPCSDRIRNLQFANTDCAKFFATTYQQYSNGKISHPANVNRVVSDILRDQVFIEATGLDEENLRAVYDSDGGQNYMFREIAKRIKKERRIGQCELILKDDWKNIIKWIKEQLPLEEGAENNGLATLQECVRAIEADLAEILESRNDLRLVRLADTLESYFTVSNTLFDPLPTTAKDASDTVLTSYVKTQVAKWYNDRNANALVLGRITSEHKDIILKTLYQSIENSAIDSLLSMIRIQLGSITDKATAAAATYPFSLALSNLLWYGTITVMADSRVGERNPQKLDDFINKKSTPYISAVISPLIARIKQLLQFLENANLGGRPPQPGDDELKKLLEVFQQSNQFAIQ